jgi:branched-subunit amino acid aminotransferase/4-amino-4-deoxychorismate lyase
MRQQIMAWLAENGQPVLEQRLTMEQVTEATHLLVSNAIIGVWPVAELDGESKALHSFTADMIKALAPAVASAKGS